MKRYNLLDLSHRRARTLVASGAPVYLCFNPVEYHGPHLSLHNDGLVSRGFVRALHEALVAEAGDRPFLFAGEIEAGVEPVPGPGSRSVPASIVQRLLEDACRSLVELGARRLVLMTFHGSPLHNVVAWRAVQNAVRNGVRVFFPAHVILDNFIDVDEERFAPAYAHIANTAKRARMIANARLDFHAGFLETSLALHFAPDSVGEYQRVPPCPEPIPDPVMTRIGRAANRLRRRRFAREVEFMAGAVGWYHLDPFPGYTGSPHLATPETGAFLAGELVSQCAAQALAVLAGKCAPPGPPLPWVPGLTLDGRLLPIRPTPAHL